jgi:hypothetical protein
MKKMSFLICLLNFALSLTAADSVFEMDENKKEDIEIVNVKIDNKIIVFHCSRNPKHFNFKKRVEKTRAIIKNKKPGINKFTLQLAKDFQKWYPKKENKNLTVGKNLTRILILTTLQILKKNQGHSPSCRRISDQVYLSGGFYEYKACNSKNSKQKYNFYRRFINPITRFLLEKKLVQRKSPKSGLELTPDFIY